MERKIRALSKSKLLAFLQCPKRLWLEVHRPNLRFDSSATQARFSVGHKVGQISQKIYDPDGSAALINLHEEGFDAALARTESLLQTTKPIFEAGFKAGGVIAFADVMLPINEAGLQRWRVIEVKSSATIKDYHRDDAAIQAFVVRACGVSLSAIAIAHIDSSWTYTGDDDYRGLLLEHDVTEEALGREEEVRSWIAESELIITKPEEPAIKTGKQCGKPFPCGFLAHCQSREPLPDESIKWLPGPMSNKLRSHIENNHVTELRDVPDNLLNNKQKRVKTATLSGKRYFNQAATERVLAHYRPPFYFIDFETISLPVPIWRGTRPYQQIPFQFSVHHLVQMNELDHYQFIELSGQDPSRKFAESLIAACGESGPVFVYNAAFEASRVRELSVRFPTLEKTLQALIRRMVDLLPLVREHYYHPDQKGSWSIKAVLPTFCPSLDYENLTGVKDGSTAMDAFLEAVSPQTSKTRKEEIQQQLLAYCEMDTLAMVRLWSVLSGLTISAR